MKNAPNGHSVVITGVSSGIGEATARYLTQHGYHVFGSVRRESDADALKMELGDLFTTLVFDVVDASSVRDSVEHVAEQLAGTRLSGLINNAGVAALGPLECLDDDVFEHSLRVNVIGSRNVINAYLPLLRGDSLSSSAPKPANAVKIINISSLSGIVNTPVSGAYCVSKHALESLGEVYRRELLRHDVDVVSIRSGPVESRIWTKNDSESVAGSGKPLYADAIKAAQKISENAAKHAIPGETIAELVLEILESRKRRTHYEVGKGSRLSRFFIYLPDRVLDKMIAKSMNY